MITGNDMKRSDTMVKIVAGNIYWQDALTSDRKVELKGNVFMCGGRVCYWYGNEKTIAHNELHLAVSRWKKKEKVNERISGQIPQS